MEVSIPQFPKRKSPRLPGFDYSSANMYFVTICTKGKKCVFGEVVNEEMVLNKAGKMIVKYWKKIPAKWNHISLDQFVVMPNHFHGLIMFKDVSVGDDPSVSPKLTIQTVGHTGPTLPTLAKVIQWFKTMSTNQYIKLVKLGHAKPFKTKLWQRSFWDHIIRNDEDYWNTQMYIDINPTKWEWDRDKIGKQYDRII